MKVLINQTRDIVQTEIDQVLERYPHHQRVFANPDRRLELTNYVLNNVTSVYRNDDMEAAHAFVDDRHCQSLKSFHAVIGLTIESAIHRGIVILLNREAIRNNSNRKVLANC